MSKSKYYIGLEIGTSNTRVVVAEAKPDLSVKVLALAQTKSAGVRKGEIVDINLARACIKSTILKAEDESNVNIGEVFLAVTGSHVVGVNNTGTLEFKSTETSITERHLEEVEDLAIDLHIPKENAFVQTLIRQYRLDGEAHRSSPVGMMGQRLDADFHHVHGMRSKFQNLMRSVKESGCEIEDLLFSPIAAAQSVLTRKHRDEGAIVLDIGGGTADYIVYIKGSIYASGCIPIGGDHITNDIHLVNKIPMPHAEKMKIDHGDVSGTPATLQGTLQVESELGHDFPDVSREVLNLVIASRLKELLTMVKDSVHPAALKHIKSGIFLTGGVSLTRGIEHLVSEVFELPVHVSKFEDLEEPTYGQDPQLSTVLGLIYYAQLLDQEEGEEPSGPLGFFAKLFGS